MLYLRKNKLQVPRHRSHVKFWNTNLTYCDIYVTYIAYQQLQIISIFSTTSENNKHHLISDDVVSRHQLIWGNGNATLTVFTYPSIFLWHGLGLLSFHLKSQPVLSGDRLFCSCLAQVWFCLFICCYTSNIGCLQIWNSLKLVKQ